MQMSEPLCSDPCARLKIQIPMHSISWGCPKIVHHCYPILLLINTFGIHIEPRSVDVKVMNKSFIIALIKMSKNKGQFCSLFLDEFLQIDLEGISCSLTC